jgi:two-component system sensor histidine kinase BaeS
VWTGATTAGLLLACSVLQRLQRVPVPGGVDAPVPYRIEGDRPPFVASAAPPRPRLGVLTWSVVLIQLVAVFGAYVAANAKALFAGHELLRARGTPTYSQYVHEGFFEVAVATLFAVACVVIGHGLLRPKGSRGPLPGGKALASIELALLALVGVTLASSVHRLSLYEDAYGYTELRLGVRLAQLAVAGLIALTAGRCVLRSWNGWGAALAWSGVAFAVLVGSTNADAWVARQNVARARAGRGLDTANLSYLSEDARVVLGDLKQVDAEAAQFLSSTWWASASANRGRDWRSWRGLGSR